MIYLFYKYFWKYFYHDTYHIFRWVLCANHMEPVKGFLGRYLRRKLLEHELRECGGTRNAEMAAVVEWLPRVWLHLNKFLESHSSSDVTIGKTFKHIEYILFIFIQ